MYKRMFLLSTMMALTIIPHSLFAQAFSEDSFDENTPRITSSTHPDEDIWYATSTARFSWGLPSSVTAVRTLYTNVSDDVPTKTYTPPIDSRSFDVDEEGTLYMHVQFMTDAGWGKVAHRAFRVDVTPPEDLSVEVVGGTTTRESTPRIIVTASDAVSGVDRIVVTIPNKQPEVYSLSETNTYTLPFLEPGISAINVAVYDKAGNKADTNIAISIEQPTIPTITNYTKRVRDGDIFEISGVADPDTSVQIVIKGEKGETYVREAVTDDLGIFSYEWVADELYAGVYELSAFVVNEFGVKSKETGNVLFVVEEPAAKRIGLFILNWLSLVLIVIVSSVLVFGTFWYSLLQFNRFRRKIHRTMKDAESTLKMNVQALRRDVEEFHTVLARAEKKRELTKEETAIMKKFKKRLDITEKEIEKKLEQIG